MIFTLLAHVIDNLILQAGTYTLKQSMYLVYWSGKKIYRYYVPLSIES